MLPSFDRSHIVLEDECQAIYRKGALVGLEIFGTIDNERAERWRRCLEEEILRRGFPEHFAIDVSRIHVANSPSSRLRSALFVRGLMRRARSAVVHAPTSNGVRNVVIRVLALGGVSNAIVVNTTEAFADALARLEVQVS